MDIFSALLAICARWPLNSPHKDQWRGALRFSLICTLNKMLSTQSWGWWFETPAQTILRPLWRQCNVNYYNICFERSHCTDHCRAVIKVIHAEEGDSLMYNHNQWSYRRKNHIFPTEYECFRWINIWHAAKRDITDKTVRLEYLKLSELSCVISGNRATSR